MISDGELLAGLAFLKIHCHPDFRPMLQVAESACIRVREDRKCDELRQRPVDDLETSVRLGCALQELGCKTVGDVERLLVDHAETDLLSSHEAKKARFGKKCLREVRELLKNIGLGARGDERPVS